MLFHFSKRMNITESGGCCIEPHGSLYKEHGLDGKKSLVEIRKVWITDHKLPNVEISLRSTIVGPHLLHHGTFEAFEVGLACLIMVLCSFFHQINVEMTKVELEARTSKNFNVDGRFLFFVIVSASSMDVLCLLSHQSHIACSPFLDLAEEIK